MNIKKLSDEIQQIVLGYPSYPKTSLDESRIKSNLEPFGLHEATDDNQVVNLPIPEGFKTWKEEAEEAVQVHTKATLDKLQGILDWSFPEMPEHFQCVPGWQVWLSEHNRWHPIAKPVDSKVFFLDVETVQTQEDKWVPICAVGMSNRGWIVWQTDFTSLPSVIPFGSGNTVVGYNVQYDRSWLDSEYLLQDQGNRFFDLMAAWIVCRGLSNQQRPLYLSEDIALDWMNETTTNSLDAVYRFYYGESLDKGTRDNLVDYGAAWAMSNMPEVIEYCARDVMATARLFHRLYPEYLIHRPSEISQSGAILLGNCWLPLDAQRFPGYYQRAEKIYQEIQDKTNQELMDFATEFLEESKGWSEIPEYAQMLDWTPAKSGVNKGLPKWYRDVLSDYKKGDLSLSKRYVPIILKMTWKGEPLLWGDCGALGDNGKPAPGWYTKSYGALPHPEKRGKAVTSVFIKGLVKCFEDGTLSSSKETAKELLKAKMSVINWVSLRKRVKSIHTESPEGFPVVLPQLVVNGTITGRCADSLWQVASNPKKTRVGTELKSMVAPPPGWVFVGADADSQEAWLAGIMGDAAMGICGSTPLGFICIAGKKAKSLEESTDIHSVMAKETGISRDNTKTRVYGALYGQGLKGDMDGLLKNIPSMSVEEARKNAELFLRKFKGEKSVALGRKAYRGGLASEAFNRMEQIADSKQPRTPLLGNLLSKSLAGQQDFKPSRVNWVIQSSGVDFRDLYILLARHFFKRLGIEGRLLMTIHDEFRFMVREGQEIQAAYACQLAHLYVRAAFIDALGLDCIPAGVAWHSAIDIDKYCLRKDPEDPQITPSQPEGLPLGYTLSPQQLLELL